MQLETVDFPFTLLTPCFSGTALGKKDDHAEMRVPPIRGHVRFWHRELFDANDANRIWGSVSGDAGHGSRVALRLAGTVLVGRSRARLLPHADTNSRDSQERRKAESEQPAIQSKAQFVLTLQRLVGCTNDDWNHAQRAAKVWLLFGCLGLRSNRAAGSVWPQGNWVPTDVESFRARLREEFDREGRGSNAWAAQLAEPEQPLPPEEVRAIASDTKGGSPGYFGDIRPHRQPSPLKLKVVCISERHCLLAAARKGEIIQGALRELRNKPRWAQLRWHILRP